MNEFFILFIGPTTNQKYVVTIRDAYGKYCSNQKMASLLDTTLKKYLALLTLYGAYDDNIGYVFNSYDKANNFASYLNQKYLVLIKLMGKI